MSLYFTSWPQHQLTRGDPRTSISPDDPNTFPDSAGRVIAVEYEKFWLINTYVPNSGEGLKFAQRRAQWDKAFLQFLLGLRAQKPVLWTGDLNVAYYDFDVSSPCLTSCRVALVWCGVVCGDFMCCAICVSRVVPDGQLCHSFLLSFACDCV